jgi:hypothetical protein
METSAAKTENLIPSRHRAILEEQKTPVNRASWWHIDDKTAGCG